jgi:hypothetical protein
MNEQDLRALVREAVERHLRPQSGAARSAPHAQRGEVRVAGLQPAVHASHIILKVVPGSEIDDGMCVIEPRVRCSHCGFCQSYGH